MCQGQNGYGGSQVNTQYGRPQQSPWMGRSVSSPPSAFGYGMSPAFGFGTNGMTKPMAIQNGGAQPVPQQWQPSFGGNAPKPFFGAQNGGMQPPPTQQQPQPSFMPSQNVQTLPQKSAQQAWQEEQAGAIRPQTVMDPAWEAQYNAKAGIQQPPQQPPMPQGPMQPGQATYHWGPPPTGNRDSGFGWQPTYFPGQNEYIRSQLGGFMGQQRLTPDQVGQINWNDAVNSIGQITGRPFNPADWSR